MPIIPNGYRHVLTIPIEEIRRQAAHAAREDIRAIVDVYPDFFVGADLIIRRYEANLEEIKQANTGMEISEEDVQGMAKAANDLGAGAGAFRAGYMMQRYQMRPIGQDPASRKLDEDPDPRPICLHCGTPKLVEV